MERIFVLAQSEERQKRQEMGHAQSLLDAEINRLGELKSYRQSYDQKELSGAGIRPAHWADYQDFLYRLGRAISEQEHHVLTGKENRDLHRKHWMEKRQRLESLQRVVDRYRNDEARQEEQRLQKSLDDRPPAKNTFSS